LSPAGTNDPDNEWDDESNVHDDNIGTAATTTQDGYLYIQLPVGTPSINMYRARIYAWATDIDIDVDFYYGGAWNNVHSGAIATLAWVNIDNPAGTQAVEQARVRYNGSATLWLYEFDFCEI